MKSVDCEQHLADARDAADGLIALAASQREGCNHDDCLVLDGIIRDCAMKINRMVVECEIGVLEMQNRN